MQSPFHLNDIGAHSLHIRVGGQSRRSDRAPMTSGLTSTADLTTVRRPAAPKKGARRAAFTSPSFPRGLLSHFRFDCFQRLCTANAHVVHMLLETFNQFTAPWSDARTYPLRVGLTLRKGSTTLGSGRWSRKRD